MRQRGGSAKQNERVTAKVHFRVARIDHTYDLFFCHSLVQSKKNFPIHVAGSFTGQAHQLELLRRLHGAASHGDGIGRDTFERGCSAPAMILLGLSSSCHTRISRGSRMSSCTRDSSKAGETKNGWPLRGRTRARRRSLSPQRMPVK